MPPHVNTLRLMARRSRDDWEALGDAVLGWAALSAVGAIFFPSLLAAFCVVPLVLSWICLVLYLREVHRFAQEDLEEKQRRKSEH